MGSFSGWQNKFKHLGSDIVGDADDRLFMSVRWIVGMNLHKYHYFHLATCQRNVDTIEHAQSRPNFFSHSDRDTQFLRVHTDSDLPWHMGVLKPWNDIALFLVVFAT